MRTHPHLSTPTVMEGVTVRERGRTWTQTLDSSERKLWIYLQWKIQTHVYKSLALCLPEEISWMPSTWYECPWLHSREKQTPLLNRSATTTHTRWQDNPNKRGFFTQLIRPYWRGQTQRSGVDWSSAALLNRALLTIAIGAAGTAASSARTLPSLKVTWCPKCPGAQA